MKFSIIIVVLLYSIYTMAQNKTGFWHGTITKKTGLLQAKYRLELKIIANGDSIIGTSYYYNSKNNYFRYSIKGYVDNRDNTVHWWDEVLLENKIPQLKLKSTNGEPFEVAADFNCPGEGKMFLKGPAKKQGEEEEAYNFDGTKVDSHIFNDEWDWVIDNYYQGAADKSILDSVAQIAYNKPTGIANDTYAYEKPPAPAKEEDVPEDMVVIPPAPKETPPPTPKPIIATPPPAPAHKEIVTKDVVTPTTPRNDNVPVDNTKLVSNPFYKNNNKPTVVAANTKEVTMDSLRSYIAANDKPISNAPAKTIQTIRTPDTTKVLPKPDIIKKLETRSIQRAVSIPIEGESITLNFYDNATIDGDSISVFLNKKLLKEHIFLSFDAQTITIPTDSLLDDNELVMVAENLGSIPPNTSTLIVYVNKDRYEVNIESSEQKSAAIRFFRKKKQQL